MYKPLNYWYDAQQRRFLEQVVLAFSGFQYETGWSERDGVRIEPRLLQVPCTMALTDRQAAAVMRNNSENTLLTVPRITVWQSDLTFRRADLQNTNHVDTIQVVERKYDTETRQYVPGTDRGRSSTIYRMMPLPFEMTIQVDVWTSNLDQKYQLAEQILTVCAPDFAIQNSDNAVDWTAMTICELQNISYSTRSMPVGSDSEIDVMSLTFRLPMYLSPPAKVTQQNVIEEIVANVHTGHVDTDLLIDNPVMRSITTPGDHTISVDRGVITLLGPTQEEVDPNGQIYAWRDLFNLYNSELRPTLTKIHLKASIEQLDDWSHDLVGSVQLDPSSPNRLIWTIDPDTLPANTVAPIDGIVNPHKRFPGSGLPPLSGRVRYLLTDEIGGPNTAWGGLVAKENDIVEYRAGQWAVLFSPTVGSTDPAYVLNMNSGEQLRWTGNEWVKTVDGIYPVGLWRIKF